MAIPLVVGVNTELPHAATTFTVNSTGGDEVGNGLDGMLGIDLYFTTNPLGVTSNDLDPPPDSDDGPNHLQNIPEITS